jgi:hypothetical protein
MLPILGGIAAILNDTAAAVEATMTAKKNKRINGPAPSISYTDRLIV